jgi:hypothetical protein
MQKVAGSKPQFQMSILLSSNFNMADMFAAFTTSTVNLPSYQAHVYPHGGSNPQHQVNAKGRIQTGRIIAM